MVAGLIHDVPSCQELVDSMMKEANDIINARLKAFAS
jgi:nitronate monooxygenase